MALTTPEDWLPVLTERLGKRQRVVSLGRSYVNGNAPLPEMGPNTKATWQAFQKKSRTNFGGIACQSHANRIRVQNVRVGSDDQSEASIAARRIARDNRLAMQVSDAVWDMLTTRVGYLVAGVGDDGRAIITSEKPETFYAEPDPTRPWKSRAAVKVWRDSILGLDFAEVLIPGARQTFTRESMSDQGYVRNDFAGDWSPAGRVETFEGDPAVWILDRRDGMGLIEPHFDVIDRINLGKLQRLSIAAIQAFRQRALKKDPGIVLPERDEAGNPIDWEKVFEPAPGA
ncbi:MAG: hypothetical protein EOL86_15020, partial [Deltaproteobacteria bacterium]|nr:hypothetical protein [Deltaproteobacteria bacterium]